MTTNVLIVNRGPDDIVIKDLQGVEHRLVKTQFLDIGVWQDGTGLTIREVPPTPKGA